MVVTSKRSRARYGTSLARDLLVMAENFWWCRSRGIAGRMLITILATLLGLAVSDGEADALRSTAPTYLTVDTARDHLMAARIAAAATGTDVNLILSIAWHEARYDNRAVTAEPGNKISCGVMTPEPMSKTVAKARCAEAGSSLIAGYIAGARHMREWIDATHGDVRAALLGYAGGYVGIRFCADPEHQKDRRCSTHLVFLRRAGVIRQALLFVHR